MSAIRIVIFILFVSVVHAEDALPSWQDGPSKQAIVAFVNSVVDKNSDSYVPAAERIAVFDNDGTLLGRTARLFSTFFHGVSLEKNAANGT